MKVLAIDDALHILHEEAVQFDTDLPEFNTEGSNWPPYIIQVSTVNKCVCKYAVPIRDSSTSKSKLASNWWRNGQGAGRLIRKVRFKSRACLEEQCSY